jgi:hypothetical protein
MKVNQIVSEHKKGVLAKKYTTKTKGAVPVYGPDSKDAKLKPVKPVGTNEAITVQPMPGASQVVSDGKPIATTDAATAQTIAQAAEKGQFNPTDGTEKPVGETGNEPVGGDPTDDFIQDVTLDDGIFDAPTNPQIEALKAMLADPRYASNPMAKAQLEKRLKIAQDRASLDQGQAMGAGGAPKPVLDPEAFSKANPNFKETQSAVYPSRNPGTPAADQAAQQDASKPVQSAVYPSRNKVQETADDVLLDKMLTIAGLR